MTARRGRAVAFVDTVGMAEAAGELLAAYQRVAGARGQVANIFRAHSSSPPAMNAHLDLYRHLLFGPSELSRREREAIAVAVSAANACHY